MKIRAANADTWWSIALGFRGLCAYKLLNPQN